MYKPIKAKIIHKPNISAFVKPLFCVRSGKCVVMLGIDEAP